MKILVAGSYRFDMYAKAYHDAFRRLGHEVRALDTDGFTFGRGGRLTGLSEKVKHHYLIGPAIGAADRALKREVREFKPDLVFLYQCYFFRPSAVKEISAQTTVFSYDNDDPFDRRPSKHNSSNYLEYARWCKMNYVFRSKNVEDFHNIGVDNVKVMMPYYMETHNFLSDTLKKCIFPYKK